MLPIKKSPTAWMFDDSVPGIIHTVDGMIKIEPDVYRGLTAMVGEPCMKVASFNCEFRFCTVCRTHNEHVIECPTCGRSVRRPGLEMRYRICECGTAIMVCRKWVIRAAVVPYDKPAEEDVI